MKLSHVIVAIVFLLLGGLAVLAFQHNLPWPGANDSERTTVGWVAGGNAKGETFYYEHHSGKWPPPKAVSFKMEKNINRQGGDYSDFNTAKGSDVSVCELACESDPKCKAFTFVKAGPRGAVPHCWLKSSVPEQTYNDDQCITGVRG
jgi:hypothetical protein